MLDLPIAVIDQIVRQQETIVKQQSQLRQLAEVLEEVITISDRKHDAWERAKALLKEVKSV